MSALIQSRHRLLDASKAKARPESSVPGGNDGLLLDAIPSMSPHAIPRCSADRRRSSAVGAASYQRLTRAWSATATSAAMIEI